MMMTSFQVWLMNSMKIFRCARLNQLEWLLRLKFGSTPKQVESDLRQLQYMGLLHRREELVLLPGQEQDRQVLAAIDIMRLLSGESLPEFGSGSPPAKLAFYLEDERGYLDFKVIPVAPGQERRVLLQLEPQLSRFVCACIFAIQQEEQIPKLAAVPRAYFALPDGKGGYHFLQAGASEGRDAARE